MSLADKQLSAFFSLVKTVHNEAVMKRQTIDNSFDYFKQVLLRHSVHRSEVILNAVRAADALYALTVAYCAGHHTVWVFLAWCKLRPLLNGS